MTPSEAVAYMQELCEQVPDVDWPRARDALLALGVAPVDLEVTAFGLGGDWRE